ncbi:hypothetical protein V8F06_014649, partial [Rhypophila decipiens]
MAKPTTNQGKQPEPLEDPPGSRSPSNPPENRHPSPYSQARSSVSPTRSTSTLEVPSELEGKIDIETWGRLGILLDLTDPTTEQTNALIGTTVALWDRQDLFGRALQAEFSKLFEDWERNHWNQVSGTALKVMRHFLMDRGVFVGLVHQSVKNDLSLIALREKFRLWIEDEIITWQDKSPKFKDRLTPQRYQEITVEQKWRPPTMLTSSTKVDNPVNNPVDNPVDNPVNNPSDHTPSPLESLPSDEPGRRNWRRPPGFEQPNPKQILDFEKLYSTNNDNKFGGGFYDVLDTKVQIFKDYIERLSIPKGCAATLFPTMLKEKAKEFYYNTLFTPAQKKNFPYLVEAIKGHFDTEEARQFYLAEWRSATLSKFIVDNPGKTKLECLDLMLDKLVKLQQSVTSLSKDQSVLRDQALLACREIPECSMALYNPAPTYEGVRNQLRNSISVALNTQQPHQQFPVHSIPQHSPTHPESPHEQYWTDRTYKGKGREKRYGKESNRGFNRRVKPNNDPKCHVCKQKGCWSTNHPAHERKEAYERYKRNAKDTSHAAYSQFVMWCEGGLPDTEKEIDPVEQYFQSDSEDDYSSDSDDNEDPESSRLVSGTYFTTAKEPVNAHQITTLLTNASVRHYFTKEDPYNTKTA